MFISQYLSSLINPVYNIGNRFVVTGAAISGIYLIGNNLAQPFFYIGANLQIAAAKISLLQSAWDNFYAMVAGGVAQNPAITNLIAYANALIGFITNPAMLIGNVIRAIFPLIDGILNNPLGTLRPIITAVINEVLGWLNDIRNVILRILGEVIQDFGTLRVSPARWIFEHLRLYSLGLSQLLLDPDNWLKEKIRVFFPVLWSILQNPREFIFNTVIEGFETLAKKYLPRILKVVENIFNDLF